MSAQSTASPLDPSLLDHCQQVEQRIRRDYSRRVLNFRIEVLDDGLVLEGRTKTYYGKQEVQHAVMEATELPILANNIVVG
jgi:hypothetical protein